MGKRDPDTWYDNCQLYKNKLDRRPRSIFPLCLSISVAPQGHDR